MLQTSLELSGYSSWTRVSRFLKRFSSLNTTSELFLSICTRKLEENWKNSLSYLELGKEMTSLSMLL